MKGLQIKCQAVGNVGKVDFLDENDELVFSREWVGDIVGSKIGGSMHTAEMMKIAESIRDLAMKIEE